MSCFWGALSAAGAGWATRAPGVPVGARPRPGSVEVVRCRGAPFLLARAIRGGQRWPVRVVLRGGWGGLYLLWGQPEWGGDEQRRGGESLRCPPRAARLVATRPTPVGDRQLPDGPSASHTHPSGSAAGSAPRPAQRGSSKVARAFWSLASRYANRCASSEGARGVGGPGRAQWGASLRPASAGSAARASAAAPRAGCDFDPGSTSPRENRSRS